MRAKAKRLGIMLCTFILLAGNFGGIAAFAAAPEGSVASIDYENFTALDGTIINFESGVTEDQLLTVYNAYYSLPEAYQGLLELTNPLDSGSSIDTQIYICNTETFYDNGSYAGDSGTAAGYEADYDVYLAADVSNLQSTCYHEFMHVLFLRVYSSRGWTGFDLDAVKALYNSEYISEYASQNVEEFMATAFALYMTNPAKLQTLAPNTYTYLDTVFPVWVEYTLNWWSVKYYEEYMFFYG